jgi:DNA-binding CsgD family transcriptional regulator
MKQLTLKDSQKLLKGVQSLYTIKNLDTFGRDTLAILAELVPTEASGVAKSNLERLLLTDTSITNSCVDLSLHQVQSLSPDFERLVAKNLDEVCVRYLDQNPFYQNLPLTLNGAYKFSDFVTRKELHSKEGYQEIMKPIGVDDRMIVSLYSRDNDKMLTWYFLYRPWESFTERDRLMLNLLQPHLNQAYQIVIRFQYCHQSVTQLHQSFERSGVICLDDAGQVKLMSSQAATWLQSYFPSNNNFSQLPEQLHSWVKHQLSQLNRIYDLPSPCLPLCLQQGNRKLTIRLVIDRPGEQYILLLAEEQVISLLAALELIGLSKREAEVLFWIIKGKDTKSIALEIRINYSTVRKHLENIYRKLKVKSQSEAIAVALERCGCLSSPAIV